MTGREMVTASLRLIGAVAPGESLSAQEATDGLAALNRMLGSWSNESLLIYAKVRDALTLVVGTQAYTMGTGGTFNTARPQRIEEAAVQDTSTTPATDTPVRILSLAEWQSIPNKAESADLPSAIYAEGTYPLETINVYPKPSAAKTLVLWSWKALTSIATLDTVVSMPPGYDEAIIYGLAVRQAPEYGRQVPDAVVMIANDSKANIKRMNHRSRYLRITDVPAGSAGSFDIDTGDNG